VESQKYIAFHIFDIGVCVAAELSTCSAGIISSFMHRLYITLVLVKAKYEVYVVYLAERQADAHYCCCYHFDGE